MLGLLREQLDAATKANQSLQADVVKLTQVRENYEKREAEWKKEEEVGDDVDA